MTVSSCIAASIQLINDADLGFNTVVDVTNEVPELTFDGSPAVYLSDGPTYRETRLSGGLGGSKRAEFTIECDLFMYADVALVTSAGTTFRGLVDGVKAVFRNNHFLNDLATTDYTMVLISGEKIDAVTDPYMLADNGTYLYHALVKPTIVELVDDGTFP